MTGTDCLDSTVNVFQEDDDLDDDYSEDGGAECFICMSDMTDIRIHHECMVRIAIFVQRITVWHHKACRVMTNGDLE